MRVDGGCWGPSASTRTATRSAARTTTAAASAYFGAPRNGGRIHEGYDVNAACGTPLVAARGGRVRQEPYDPVLYGNLVIIRGRRTHRDYWYAHLRTTPRVAKGDRVRTGQRLGEIGATGNAASVGCHLHFEVRAARRAGRPGAAPARLGRVELDAAFADGDRDAHERARLACAVGDVDLPHPGGAAAVLRDGRRR